MDEVESVFTPQHEDFTEQSQSNDQRKPAGIKTILSESSVRNRAVRHCTASQQN